eukprot:CAMPEP_0113968798 /NCGR_PEP_ID=MMETSP0011_2-20120614/9781_1 /TAXON_ID=101924 /ORGANISM="Rhodosorus marinus" /LENGTH=528 /DNA_ID=CAMNT_0000982023 /DNA_START=178 /DNA_END=1764 /DNA_ORIENTATION=- /assembly_acc=CAM_ASM_000156
MDRAERYDRQIRVWGDAGQERLEDAHVCVINSSALGTESLKSLVLPGIGAFTLIDGKNCTVRDLGRNFFVTEDQVTKNVNRAEACSMLLRDLNHAVEGNYVSEDISDVLNRTEDLGHFFSTYSLVVAADLAYGPVLQKVASACYSAKVPLIVCRINGLFGLVRIIAPEHLIENSRDGVDSKQLSNLCLSDPFPELVEYAAKFDLDALDDFSHKHVPYVVLLVKASMEWKTQKGLLQIVERRDVEGIRELLQSWRRPHEEENFDEALRKAYLVMFSPERNVLSSEAFDGRKGEDGKGPSSSLNRSFWLFVASLKKFVEEEGRLPVSGKLPDMTSDTESYVGLQRIYQSKSRKDAEKLASYVDRIAHETRTETMSAAQVQYFTNLAPYLSVQRTRPLEDELRSCSADLERALKEESSIAHLYIFFRAADMHLSESLGNIVEDSSKHFVELQAKSMQILSEMGMPPGSVNIWREGLLEFLRYDGSEIHSIASILGGIIAQESVKLLTRQFVPVKNTIIFNGANATTTVLEL